jgi:hypothetical protein
MNTLFKKTLAATLLVMVFAITGFALVEPEAAGAASATDTVVITLNVTAGISITSPSDTTMSATLGVAQHSATATTTWNVKTNSAAGYTLAVRATSTPAMTATAGGYTIADYQVGAPNTWNATTGNAYFGYSAFGTDISTGTWGSGSVCYGASQNATSTTLKYKGLTTSDVTVATRSSTTTPTGNDSTFCYAVEQNNFYIPSATYQATVIATATTL